MTKHTPSSSGANRPAGAQLQIEITPEMIEAGLAAYFEFEADDVGAARAISEIYRAMAQAA